jgi:hypothetical protein
MHRRRVYRDLCGFPSNVSAQRFIRIANTVALRLCKSQRHGGEVCKQCHSRDTNEQTSKSERASTRQETKACDVTFVLDYALINVFHRRSCAKCTNLQGLKTGRCNEKFPSSHFWIGQDGNRVSRISKQETPQTTMILPACSNTQFRNQRNNSHITSLNNAWFQHPMAHFCFFMLQY